ncbi:MBL fold metallo-hydrolase [Lacibacter sp. MH-610]|uniref:MBL fold metallo-hydrolase n=1 Tax=Lacibacter sp. MH-610 TaxID=3020883 RepID=UPI0038913D14
MNLYTINTGYFKLDGGAMFGVVPKSIWNKLNPADENNMCNWALRCLLIEDGNRLILIDTGNGTKQDEKFWSHYYLHGDDTLHSSLAQHGFKADDITDVILTHLHFDHCGGAVDLVDGKLVTAFKNATYWSNEAHWDWAVHPNAREKASFLKENILPIQESGQLKFMKHDGQYLLPDRNNKGWSAYPPESSINYRVKFTENISIRFADGHTSAMMLPQIEYKGRTIVYMADLLPSAAHIPLPYVMGYDMNPLRTLQEKEAFLKEAVAGDFILFFEHDPKIECCTLQQTEKGVRMKEAFPLTAI